MTEEPGQDNPNCRAVRLLLAERDPGFAAFTEAAAAHDDLAAGLCLLVSRMSRPAGQHPALALAGRLLLSSVTGAAAVSLPAERRPA